MSDLMPAANPNPEPTDLLSSEEVADRVRWAAEEIASLDLTPGPKGKPWAGRGKVIAKAIAEFGLSREQAEALVEEGADLLRAGASDQTEARRAAIDLRLGILRRLVMQEFGRIRKEKIYKIEGSGGERKLILVKEKHIQDSNLAVIKLLAELEKLRAEVMGLTRGRETSAQGMAAILAQLDAVLNKKNGKGPADGRNVRRSIMGLIKTGNYGAAVAVNEEAPAPKRKRGRPRKNVTAHVIDPDGDDDGD